MLADDKLSISDDLLSLVGKELPSLTKSTKIDESLVADFTEAVRHPNARFETEWEGQEVVKAPEYKKGMIVSPSILWTRRVSYRGHWVKPLLPLVPSRGLDGGGEWHVFSRIRIGDIITARSKLSDVSEHFSKSLGKMLVVVVETIYSNQEGQVIGKYRHKTLRYTLHIST
ncbi:MaoC family dehydratase N-terminal domain-containing protein [Chloroflexota bacterium]